MERYQKLLFVNLKHNLLIPLLLVLSLCLFSPLFVGMENLDEIQTARVVEVFLSLIGIILLMTIFSPDIDRDIRDIISSRKESMLSCHLLRIFSAVIPLLVIGFLLLLWMKSGDCQFDFLPMYFTFMANTLFLGGLGVFFFSLTNQPVLGIMASILFFLLSFGTGRKYMGKFFLFSLQYGSFTEKYYLMAGGIILLLLAVIWRDILWKKLI